MEIKEIRTLTGLSQANFGKKYNIPVRTIQDWETEKRNRLLLIKILIIKLLWL